MCYNWAMRKVIVKSQLKDRQQMLRQAEWSGMVFGETVWQHERVFLPSNYQPKMGYARMILRTDRAGEGQPDIYTLEMRRHVEENHTDIVEQTTVGDYVATAAMLQQMGYVQSSELARQRQSFELSDATVFYLDILETLDGSFLKIETSFDDDAKIDGIRKDMFQTLRLLGQETFILQTYDELVRGEQLQPYSL